MSAIAWWLLQSQRESLMYNVQQYPMPPLRRMMMFIDGENLVMRFKEMLESGRAAQPHVIYDKDTVVWNNNTIIPQYHMITRAIYYTYVQGDDDKVEATSEAIRRMTFHQYRPSTQPHVIAGIINLYPKVYKKGKGKKAKGVDIQMTVDILTNIYQDNMDSVYLLSGDGDYKPVIEECIRRGKQVFIGAFSSGLNEGLKLIADRFFSLDDYYFLPAGPREEG